MNRLVVAVVAAGALAGCDSSRPISPAVIPAAAPRPAAARELPDVPIIPQPSCDARIAMRARLRERSEGIEYVTRTIRFLEIMNGGTRARVLGWSAESADEGPPCLASFAYEFQGVRHTLRFKFWPEGEARLATANADATDAADVLESQGLLGPGFVQPTQPQLTLATMTRLAHGVNSEDVYMHPHEPGVLVVRRAHCVAGNVDMRTPLFVRTFRTAHVTRLECHADENWTLDIPPRGPVAEPHLP